MYRLSDITVIKESRTILNVPSLDIPSDKLTVILGHNGSGKSTLVNLLAGQAKPDQGSVKLNGSALSTLSAKKLAQEIAYLPQHLPQASGLTVKELVKLGRYPWRGVFGRFNSNDDEIISQAMCATQVESYSNHSAEKLSGGERQRAWISMLIAQQSPVLILDEPTSALDIHHQYQVLELLKTLNTQQGKGVLVILHDLNLTLRFADHVIALKQGEVVFSGSTNEIADEATLSELYHTPIKLMGHPTQQHKVAVVC
ncbi:ABC transporter ATP-binding protein [Vibrio agarivorans]|uniref:ABC transporter ATP-binding protein n=1 Tax=Vibrio agarivorans TaxID=153622 RepID=A0ABT7Y610_9VIBR|nr:ABC transporter ATP-binding protein [Vibrio agarivorans]MDN2483490.1 ABC transporter ATP-binding protein [Vibrio agarivorans]